MTKAACDLILAVSTLCLSWRTIKALKRTGTKQFDYKDQESATCTSDDDTIDTDIVIDWEILQLWALYALHVIYSSSGAEWFVSLIPFYYYLKMILLIITVVPSTKFPNFWYETFLVPMMKRTHTLLDIDWMGYFYNEAAELPHRLLGFLIISDEEALAVKNLREEQLRDALGADSTNMLHDEFDYVPGKSASPSHHQPKRTSGSVRRPKPSIFTSPLARSRVAASGLHLQKFSRSHRRSSSESESAPFVAVRTRSRRQFPTQPIEPKTPVSVPRRRADRSKINNSTGSNINKPPVEAFKHIDSSNDRRRKVPTSNLHRQQMARSPITSTIHKSQKIQVTEETSDRNGADINVNQSPRSRTSRSSIGLGVRKFITGDTSIRIRDYLFDVNLPNIPAPTRPNDPENSSPVNKARRRQTMDDSRRKLTEGWRKNLDKEKNDGGFPRGSGSSSSSLARQMSRNRSSHTQPLKSSRRTPKIKPVPEASSHIRSMNVTVRRSRRLAAAKQSSS